MQLNRRDFLLLLGAWTLRPRSAASKPDEIAVIAHPHVPITRLSDVELEAIFLTDRRFWEGTRAIIPFNLAPHSDTRVQFDLAVLRMDPEAVARFWRDRRVRGGAPPPRQAPDLGTLVRLVAHLEGAIGYAPMEHVANEVRILARIRQGKLVAP
jgi:ABC-type phosphate transport system substrate-binding protein